MKITKLFLTIISTTLLMSTAQPKSWTAKEVTTYNTNIISKMISAIQPELKKADRNRIAYSLYKTTKKYNIDPKLMIAIIGTESDFVNSKVSKTGDLSMAQINTTVWNKEFVRLELDKLNSKRLKKDEAYALNKMAEILNILKARHAKKDNQWFARYHSQTKKHKNEYSIKVEKRLRKISSVAVTMM